ncbi:engulfment and cell motility protein 2-like [Chrysoperla carnea]|uniref:engulfment and cell motility protein 2-like n=1 Tax=Chrysoperla carnea TaxID=189513 RepID=UPI001D077C85|nr:engulfment and cell motility protein 2-like [Chrysoperla carnea]
MNIKISRKTISETILNSETKLSPEMEKELHMYQTYILSLNLEKTTHKINLSDDNFDLKFLQEDMSHYMNQNLYSRTISFYESLKTAEKPKQDYNEGANTSKFFLGEDISDSLALLFDDDYTSYYHDIDASLKWVSHANKDTYNDFLEESSYILRKTVTNENEITELTLECLVYFKQKYPQSYHIAYLEQNEYEPGFFTTSERICQIMCEQLRIGQDPLKNSTLYCPLVFSSLEQPFLSEIFCRLMWLYVKTRIEMSAKTGDDQLKVLAVLHTQTKLVFNTKPKTYNDFMAALKCFPYSFISILWKNEQRVKWKRMLENNPNIIELSEAIEPQITGLIKENRYKHLMKGNKFHLFEREKKSKPQWIYFRLLQNQQQLVYSEWNPQYEICSLEVTTIHISDIKYLVTGNACVHVKDHRVKKPDFAFSILTEDNSYDFEAINESVYNTWIDGLSALIGKEMGSNFYQKDKSKLLELELMLRLLDTENIPLPMTPPPIPPPPSNYNFYYDDNESTC